MDGRINADVPNGNQTTCGPWFGDGVLYKKKKGSWGIRVVYAMCICPNIKVHNNALDRKVESCWIKI